jgi:hypothetical protein
MHRSTQPSDTARIVPRAASTAAFSGSHKDGTGRAPENAHYTFRAYRPFFAFDEVSIPHDSGHRRSGFTRPLKRVHPACKKKSGSFFIWD